MVKTLLVTLTTLLCLTACAPEGSALDEGSWDLLDAGKADGVGSSTYGALARLSVPRELEAMRAAMVVLDDDVLPHEAKAFRKQIGRLRDHVDMFAFAYKPGKHRDAWKEIRDELDVGYESVGHFKDLFDVQDVIDPAQAEYDLDEVADQRDEVLTWAAGFGEPAHAAEVDAYLAAPSIDKLYDRPKADQARFYWREAGIEPDHDLSGLKNIARLQRALIDEARDDLAETPEIGKLTKEEHAIAFHDFRKRIRSIEKITTYFPEITRPKDAEEAAALLPTVVEAVDRYGALNDRIGAYLRAKDGDDDDRADDIADDIADGWDELLAWQEDVDLDEVLDDLRATVRK